MAKQTDAVAVQVGDTLTNARLHEQMTQGVNDHDIRMETRKKLKAAGVADEHLEKVLP